MKEFVQVASIKHLLIFLLMWLQIVAEDVLLVRRGFKASIVDIFFNVF